MKTHLSQILIALLLFGMITVVSPSVMMWWREKSNPEDWFEVNQIYVTDFQVGTEPVLSYDRTIKKPFSASWTVEVQVISPGNLYTVCSGRGQNEYKPDHTLPPAADLTWFIGAKCVLPPGTYRINAYWNISIPNYPMMKYEAISNVFTVTKDALIK